MKLARLFIVLTMVTLSSVAVNAAETVTSGTPEFAKALNTERINSIEEIEWHQISVGSQGGADSSFFHPTDPDYVYISQNMRTTYMSRDGMTSVDTWETISDEDTNGNLTSISQVYQMKFSLQDEDFGVAGNNSGLYVTNDKGKNWRPFAEDTFSHEYSKMKSVSAVTIDPEDDDIIYAGLGGFWKNKDSRTDAKRYKAAPKNSAGAIYKTTDGGKTWTRNTAGLPAAAEIGQIFVHPKERDTLYVATSHGNFISHDGGATYEPINDGLADPVSGEVYVRDLAFHYDEETDQVTLVTATLTVWDTDENKDLVHTSGGVYKSLDEGATWESLNDGLMVDYTPFTVSEVINAAPMQGFTVGVRQWFGYKDKAELLANVNLPKTILPNFREVEINPANPNILYAVNCGRKEVSVEPEGVWISEDGGKNWFISTRIGRGYQEDADYWAAQYAPEDVDLTTRNVAIGGEEDWSWMFEGKYPMLAYQFLAVSPDGETLITHVFKSRIVSRDGGRTWEQVDSVELADGVWLGRGNSNVPGKTLVPNPHTGEVLFASGETGLWQINKDVEYDHIETDSVPMQRIDPENQIECPGGATAFHPHEPETIYSVVSRLGHRGEFVKSTNGGKDWQTVSTIHKFGTADSIKTTSLLIDKNDPDTMYFVLPTQTFNETESRLKLPDEERGVYKTMDGGVTWKMANDGITSSPAEVMSIAFSNDHKTLYAAVMYADGGLYRSTDAAENWVEMTLPTGVNAVNDVTVAPSGRITISTGVSEDNGMLCAGGVYQSDDEGATWTKIFDGRMVIETTVDPNNEERMILTAGNALSVDGLNQGLFMTTDGGDSWVKINNGIGTPNQTTEVVFDPLDENVVWASSYSSGFYKLQLPKDFSSADKEMTLGDEVNRLAAAVDAFTDDIVVAGGALVSAGKAVADTVVSAIDVVAETTAGKVVTGAIVSAGGAIADAGGAVANAGGVVVDTVVDAGKAVANTVTFVAKTVADSDAGKAVADTVASAINAVVKFFDFDDDEDVNGEDAKVEDTKGEDAKGYVAYIGELLLTNEDFPAGEIVQLRATVSDWQNYTVTLSSSADIAIIVPEILEVSDNVISFEFIMPNRDVDVSKDFRFEFK